MLIHPALMRLAEWYAPEGLAVITVSMDEASDRPAVLRFLGKQGARVPNYLRLGGDFEAFVNAVDQDWIGALPAIFVYDRSGTRVRSQVGELKPTTLEGIIRTALGRS